MNLTGWIVLGIGVAGLAILFFKEPPAQTPPAGSNAGLAGTYDSGWEAARAIANTAGLLTTAISGAMGSHEVSQNTSTRRAPAAAATADASGEGSVAASTTWLSGLFG